MHLFEGGTFVFQERKGCLLLIEHKGNSLLLIEIFALPKQVVIEPTALFKGGIELVNVFLRGVDPILKHFAHTSIIARNRTSVKYRLPADSNCFISWLICHYSRNEVRRQQSL